MRLFRFELYKISSYKVANVSAVACILFLILYFWQGVLQAEYVKEPDAVYYGREAVAKEKETAARYEGPVTIETARAILAEQGLPPWTKTYSTLNGTASIAQSTGVARQNFCNRFVYDRMMDTGGGDGYGDRRAGLLGADAAGWENLYGESAWFGHPGGWSDFCKEFFGC